MEFENALQILEKYNYIINNGIIQLHEKESEEEIEAINYLCSEWDYSCERLK